MSGVVKEDGASAWSKEVRPNKSIQKLAMKSNDTTGGLPGYDEKIKNCSSCGGSRDPKVENTCVKNITGEKHCPLKSEFFDILHLSEGRHPDSGDILNPRHGYVCYLCGCGGHGHRFCPYDPSVQKDSRKERTKRINTLRSELRSKCRTKSSMGARVSQKPSWGETKSDEDIDDDDVDAMMDTDGYLMPDHGTNYVLVVTNKKANGDFTTCWQQK